jgi:hypothetical protein
MRGAAEVYRDGHITQWLPKAERRIAEMKAELARMKTRRAQNHRAALTMAVRGDRHWRRAVR